jgi:hypothetical protein
MVVVGIGTEPVGKSNFGGATGDIGERSRARKRDSELTSSTKHLFFFNYQKPQFLIIPSGIVMMKYS